MGFLKTTSFPQIRELLESGCIVPPAERISVLNHSTEGSRSKDLIREDSWIVGWGHVKRSSAPEDDTVSIYTPDFFLEESNPWASFQFIQTLSRVELLQELETFLVHLGCRIDQSSPYFLWESPRFKDFEKVFTGIQEQISQGILKKAVPVVFLQSSEFKNPETLIIQRAYLLLQLLKNTQGTPVYLYGWWDSGGNGILGATPELLFTQSSESQIQTMALAGTRVKTEGSHGVGVDSLLDDPKERLEHQIVVDSIQSSLNPLGRVLISQTQELHLQTLVHLHTPISLQLESSTLSSNFSSWVKALHPTPALGAYPKESGWIWLKAQESDAKRHRFGAPFGVFFNRNSSYCLVAIRNLQWIAGRLLMGAGCGVVGSSQLEREWTEIQGKLQAIHRSFGFDLRNEARFL